MICQETLEDRMGLPVPIAEDFHIETRKTHFRVETSGESGYSDRRFFPSNTYSTLQNILAFSRRQFVGLGGLFVAPAIAPFAGGSPSPSSVGAPIFDPSLEVPLQYMDRNPFIPLIATRSLVHTTTPRTVPLTLI